MAIAAPSNPSRAGSRLSPVAIGALVFVVIALARAAYVSLYASALPYWDQWDGLDLWFRPWTTGALPLSQLLAPHNEHRIALTRLWGLLLFALNGRTFDNLVNSYANALPYAGMWALVYTLMTRDEVRRGRRWALALAVVVLGVLPFDWENTLIGFQSQFYFMELVAVAAVGVASYCRASWRALAALAAIAVVGLFTMASGVLAAPAACAVLALLAAQDRSNLRHYVATIVALVGITVVGLLLIPKVPGDTAMHAVGVGQNARAMLIALQWPSRRASALAIVVWLPLALWLAGWLRTRKASRNEVFAAGLAIWVLLQFLAIAHARGENMAAVASRYSEIPAIGVACNLWLAIQLAGRVRRGRIIALTALVVGVGAVGYAFWVRTPSDHAAMAQRHDFTTVETQNVTRYLTGIPLPTLPANSQLIPYPTATRLQRLLDNANIRALLAPSILPRPGASNRAPLSRAAASLQHWIRSLVPVRIWAVAPDLAATHSPSVFTAYAGTIPANTLNTQCSLDAINGKASADAGAVTTSTAVYFGGWAGNGAGAPLGSGLLVLAGETQFFAAPLTTGASRSDVAHALGDPALAHSGYNLEATLTRVPAGRYALYVASASAQAQSFCNLHRTLTVRE